MSTSLYRGLPCILQVHSFCLGVACGYFLLGAGSIAVLPLELHSAASTYEAPATGQVFMSFHLSSSLSHSPHPTQWALLKPISRMRKAKAHRAAYLPQSVTQLRAPGTQMLGSSHLHFPSRDNRRALASMVYVMPATKPKALCMLDKHSTN